MPEGWALGIRPRIQQWRGSNSVDVTLGYCGGGCLLFPGQLHPSRFTRPGAGKLQFHPEWREPPQRAREYRCARREWVAEESRQLHSDKNQTSDAPNGYSAAVMSSRPEEGSAIIYGAWEACDTEKWCYSIALKFDENANISFVANRLSTNDGLAHENIGDLHEECATLEEAKRTVQQWHAERYADNDAEFDKRGGNTGRREDFETEQWSGQLKCQICGKPITDSYTIQGILHHGLDLQCETCPRDPGHE